MTADIFIYIITSVVLLVLVFIMTKAFVSYNEKHLDFIKKEHEMLSQRFSPEHYPKQNSMLQTRVQAYERTVLLLERINPSQMIPRSLAPGQTARSLEIKLQQTVREEFEHNLSQQIYISDLAWDLVKTARESVSQRIRKAAEQTDPAASAADLAQAVLLLNIEKETDPLEKALKLLKKEVRELLNS
ncbi:MAG: hypothetical protein JXR65_07065 [Bacteroidales bacterium]|nr:hypothetical protein [Bacteroidales bacterium]